MKIKGNRFVKIIGLTAFGGLILSPFAAIAQDQGGRPPEFRPRPAMPGGEMKGKPDYAKIRGMVHEMAELKRAGKQDEANQLAGKIKAAVGNDPRICGILGRVMADPGKAKSRRQADEQPKSREPDQMGKAPDDAVKNARVRLQHLREAAMHLNAAGCEEMANDVRWQISQMERRLKNQSKPQRQGEFQQRKEAKPDANAAIISEIRKLRQEMGELRNQVRRVQANATQRKESKIREDRPNPKERPDQRPHAPLARPNAPMPPPGPPADRPQ